MKITSKPPIQFGAVKVGQRVKIETPDGLRVGATFIGHGRFSNVFAIGKQVIIYSHYGDLSKEILAMCRTWSNNPHLPEMKKLGSITGQQKWDIGVYLSRRYNAPLLSRHVKPSVWAEIKSLRASRMKAANGNSPLAYFVNSSTVQKAEITVQLRDALSTIVDTAANYGDNRYLFDDFQARNLATDNYGRLILLDTLFNLEVMHNDMLARTKRE